jgi:hypothetical protein
MSLTASRIAALAIFAAAFMLHAYQQLLLIPSPNIAWFLWSMLPYGICGLILLRTKSGIPGAAGAVIAFAWDLAAHYDVFIHPRSSTAGLAMLFVPLWSSVIYVPVAAWISWLALRLRSDKPQHVA